MTLEEIVDKYFLDLEVEVSEKSEEEKQQLIKDMESIGFRFNRSEHRYISCEMWIFENK